MFVVLGDPWLFHPVCLNVFSPHNPNFQRFIFKCLRGLKPQMFPTLEIRNAFLHRQVFWVWCCITCSCPGLSVLACYSLLPSFAFLGLRTSSFPNPTHRHWLFIYLCSFSAVTAGEEPRLLFGSTGLPASPCPQTTSSL